jgi:translation initiation factor 2 alpha subunit (eIF-2alpha)
MVNELQRYTMGIPLKNGDVYKLYCDIFPKESRPAFIRYIKGKKEKKYDEFLLDTLKDYFEVGKSEISDYLDILYLSKEGKEVIKNILQKYGVESQVFKKYKLG